MTPFNSWPVKSIALLAAVATMLVSASGSAFADRISHPTAVFSGLDKITGRIISFEVATNETVQFGSLQITERACYTRPATEAPQTVTFVQVDEIDVKKQLKRIFSGWMFAASPGLNGIEHPVYDIWLTDCKGGTTITPSPDATAEAEPPVPDNAKNPPPKSDHKPRRADSSASRPSTTSRAQTDDGNPPQPRRARPPSRAFFPDEAGGSRDPGGLY